jgi:hypothetical protein
MERSKRYSLDTAEATTKVHAHHCKESFLAGQLPANRRLVPEHDSYHVWFVH